MSEGKTYPVSKDFAESALVDKAKYDEMYAHSVDNPDEFWGQQAEEFVDWFKPFDVVQEWDFHKAEIAWFKGGKLNVSYNWGRR